MLCHGYNGWSQAVERVQVTALFGLFHGTSNSISRKGMVSINVDVFDFNLVVLFNLNGKVYKVFTFFIYRFNNVYFGVQVSFVAVISFNNVGGSYFKVFGNNVAPGEVNFFANIVGGCFFYSREGELVQSGALL